MCLLCVFSVQVDVLEAQFSQLMEKIQSTHDFESIKHAHESFVTTLQSQLFFTMPAVSQLQAPNLKHFLKESRIPLYVLLSSRASPFIILFVPYL